MCSITWYWYCRWSICVKCYLLANMARQKSGPQVWCTLLLLMQWFLPGLACSIHATWGLPFGVLHLIRWPPNLTQPPMFLRDGWSCQDRDATDMPVGQPPCLLIGLCSGEHQEPNSWNLRLTDLLVKPCASMEQRRKRWPLWYLQPLPFLFSAHWYTDQLWWEFRCLLEAVPIITGFR